MMHIFPRLPHRILIDDYFRGERDQKYRDSNGEHQFEKRLRLTRIINEFADEFKKDYKRACKGNWCPLKLNRALHRVLMERYGMDTITGYFISWDSRERYNLENKSLTG